MAIRLSSPPSSILLSIIFFSSSFLLALSKSTIEPCTGSDTCNSLIGYTVYADLKVSELAALFQADPIAVLSANSIDISVPDVENRILPAGIFLKVPVSCSCSGGIRRSISTRYTTRPLDTLESIAGSVYSGLASADQIRDANSIADPGAALDVGRSLVVPLPCTCFNSTDNNFPAVYLSYVVRAADTVAAIAAEYSTTVTDIMNVNAMGTPSVGAGDIIAVPLPACASSFPSYASDSGLIVANGSYAITAGHCVQCSCGPGNLNLYCMPSPLAVSCSSMQCRGSNLMLGNSTIQQTSAGCNVTSCAYGGFVNGTIATMLTTTLQPQCPGKQHQFPAVIPPPSTRIRDLLLAPSPSMAEPGGIVSMAPSTSSLLPGTALTPAGILTPVNGGPSGSTSQAPSSPSPATLNLLILLLLLLCLNFVAGDAAVGLSFGAAAAAAGFRLL